MLQRIPRWVLVGCVLLAAVAGFVNSIALLSFAQNGVSHVTGTLTLAADELVNGHWMALFSALSIVACFLLGALVCGILIDNEALIIGHRYGLAMLFEAALLLLALYFFRQNSFLGELCASMACGLQNAMVTTYSGSIIRTTHLTGIVTDIGSALGHWLAGRGIKGANVLLQSAIALGFFAGAGGGAALFVMFGFNSILVPVAVLALAGVMYLAYRVNH